MSDKVRLKEIRDVLLVARNEPDYNIGSPRAIDHLLCHLVAAIDAIIDEPVSEPHEDQSSPPGL
ncbi:hypothetical protein [Rhizobium leguminosarum]|uniref:hypothetical protein n=1 Tax=Rhizobium leguminosarum TaxID=384 RepID=UPI001C9683F3|nr:hypothetical protein [Rhizobium leguminosarum]MBY5821462.1 hypothetical protein [Rhizobium leguminosarum]